MRAYWTLPNRNQGDDILATDGAKAFPLREILDPTRRPEGFSHGVPTEILEKYDPGSFPEILFAQTFPGWNGAERLVSISTMAGLDASGRVVHLGLLLFLAGGEEPTFDIPCTGLSDQDAKRAAALLARLSGPRREDRWAQSVRDLLEISPDLGPATNVELERSVTRFASLYTLGARGLRRKIATARWRSSVVVILIVAFISAALVVLHGARCPAAPRAVGEPSAHAGQLTSRVSHPSGGW